MLPLSTILSITFAIELKNCKNTTTLLQSLEVVRKRDHSNQTRHIIFSFDSCDLNQLIIDPNNKSLSQPGSILADVVRLSIQNSLISPTVTQHEALLKFFNSLQRLKYLSIANQSAFSSENHRLAIIDQAIRKSGLITLTLDFPMTDADLAHISKLLTYNDSITELKFPQGRFSSSALQRVALALRSSNTILEYLDLPKDTSVPAELTEVLKNNRQRRNFKRWKQEAQKTIDEVNNTLASDDLMANANNLLQHWRNVSSYCDCLQEISKAEVAPSSLTYTLCEDLAVAGSKLLMKTLPYLLKQPDDYYAEGIRRLAKMSPLIRNPQVKATFASNMYAFCQYDYSLLMDAYDTAKRNGNETFSVRLGATVSTQKKLSPYHSLKVKTDLLIDVLSSIPPDEGFYYQDVNAKLLQLLKYKVAALIEKTNINGTDEIINKIHDQRSNIKDLLTYLLDFIESLWPVTKISAQFAQWFTIEHGDSINPINALRKMSSEILQIYIDRKMAVAETQNQQSQALLPPATPIRSEPTGPEITTAASSPSLTINPGLPIVAEATAQPDLITFPASSGMDHSAVSSSSKQLLSDLEVSALMRNRPRADSAILSPPATLIPKKNTLEVKPTAHRETESENNENATKQNIATQETKAARAPTKRILAPG